MSDLGSLLERQQLLEKSMHTTEHRVSVLENALSKMPERLTVVEHQIHQLSQLPSKIDQQNAQILSLRDVVIENQNALKRYLSWMAGAGGVVTFLLTMGGKLVKFLGQGVI